MNTILNNNKKSRDLIIQNWKDDWRIKQKNDGIDYLRMLLDFQEGKLDSVRLSTGSPFRTVFKVKVSDHYYVIKHDTEKEKRFEKRLWFFLAGTPYSRLIKLTAKAVKKECPVVQDIYLVSEKMSGFFCHEAYIITEYIQGQTFIREEHIEGSPIIFFKPDIWLKEIAKALAVLHDYGLASNDAIVSNFVITPEHKVKVIDLTLNGPIPVCQVNDVLKMRRSYQTEVPMRKISRRLLAFILSLQYRLRRQIRIWRKRTPPPVPPKIWESYEQYLTFNNKSDGLAAGTEKGVILDGNRPQGGGGDGPVDEHKGLETKDIIG